MKSYNKTCSYCEFALICMTFTWKGIFRCSHCEKNSVVFVPRSDSVIEKVPVKKCPDSCSLRYITKEYYSSDPPMERPWDYDTWSAAVLECAHCGKIPIPQNGFLASVDRYS